jgi:hypothetical protein
MVHNTLLITNLSMDVQTILINELVFGFILINEKGLKFLNPFFIALYW